MKRKSIKTEIRKQHTGKGKAWVKVDISNEVFNEIIEKCNEISKDLTFNYVNDIKREGFAWLRFLKPSGNNEKPYVTYEIKFLGSKEDHEKYNNEINVPYEKAKHFTSLDSTPFKLGVETQYGNKIKSKNVEKTKVNKSKEENVKDEIVSMSNISYYTEMIDYVNESELDLPTKTELANWNEFLKLNGICQERLV